MKEQFLKDPEYDLAIHNMTTLFVIRENNT